MSPTTGSEEGATMGVERCDEGHDLQASAAECAGSCHGCKRWVFAKEKIMSCACCSVYYCSKCSPQVRTNKDDKMWDDILSTVGGALRDAESMKTRLATEISGLNIDVTRMRSAFNCQEPGTETLSAEQIYVEHAYEQVKSKLNCAAPEEEAHEEVIEHPRRGCLGEAWDNADRNATRQSQEPKPDDANVSDMAAQRKAEVANAAPDLLDLSHPAQQGNRLGEAIARQTDLLDINVEPKLEQINGNAVHDLVDLLDLSGQQPSPQPDLLDLADQASPAAVFKGLEQHHQMSCEPLGLFGDDGA